MPIKKAELIDQEARGILLTYNVIRREASQTALIFASMVFDRNPSDTKFRAVYQHIAVQVIVVTGAQAVSGTERRLAKFLWPVGSEKNPAYNTLNTFLQNEQTHPQTKKP